jgi:hypothetical protein
MSYELKNAVSAAFAKSSKEKGIHKNYVNPSCQTLFFRDRKLWIYSVHNL